MKVAFSTSLGYLGSYFLKKKYNLRLFSGSAYSSY